MAATIWISLHPYPFTKTPNQTSIKLVENDRITSVLPTPFAFGAAEGDRPNDAEARRGS